MRKAQRCLEVFRAPPVFLLRLSKTRSTRTLAFLSMCATCSRLAAVTSPAHLTLPARQFYLSGRGGCSIRKNQFFSCSSKMTTLKEFSVYLFERDTNNSRVIIWG